MRKSAILGVLILMMSVFAANALAGTTDGMTPAEETVCDPLKADGITKALYGLCVAYCEAIDGPAEFIEGDDLSELNPPNSILLAVYQNKMREGDPEMPCVNYVGACPVWSKEELDRIGTLGGSYRDIVLGGDYIDIEIGTGFQLYAMALYNGGNYVGKYYAYAPASGIPWDYRLMSLTEDEYNSCMQTLIDHTVNN